MNYDKPKRDIGSGTVIESCGGDVARFLMSHDELLTFPWINPRLIRSYSVSMMLTSSQTEQRCQLAFGWRTAKPLCPEGLSRNAKMKTGNKTVRQEELQIFIYIKKYSSMSHSPALPVYYDELFLFSVMTSQSPSCWWIPCAHRGNLPELTNTKTPSLAQKLHKYIATNCAPYMWVWLYLSDKGLFQAFIGISPDLGEAAEGKKLIQDRWQSLANHLN